MSTTCVTFSSSATASHRPVRAPAIYLTLRPRGMNPVPDGQHRVAVARRYGASHVLAYVSIMFARGESWRTVVADALHALGEVSKS